MLKPAARYGLYALAAVLAVAVVAACLLACRLSSGPLPAPGLRGPVERMLARSVDGGRASVGQVQAVWFAKERSVGLRLSDVRLDDGKGRPVLRASSVETGLAVDSALVLTPAPGRLTARDFFAAVSVSPKGGYELGYDADGAPKPVALRTLLDSLTGESRRGRPLSFLRRLDLDEGVLVMRQVGGPVAWRGEVETLAFTKADGRIAADARLSLRGADDLARINGTARGQVGLPALVASGYFTGLHPSRVFPAVGFTRRLAQVDAPIEANGRLEYALDQGFKAADVTATAGAGRLLMGRMTQALNAAHIVTRYDPKTRQVLLETAHVDGEKTRIDATGRLWLEPQTGKTPARIEYRLASDDSRLTVAPSAEPQRIQGFTAHGRFTPTVGEFEVREARLLLEGAPVRANLMLRRGKAGESWGLKAAVDVDGVIGPGAVFAFWPEHLGRTARAWVVAHLHEADVSNTRLRADLPPGQMQRYKLSDEMLRIDFDFADAAVSITPTLPRIDHAFGSGVVQGDRFDLAMSRGRLQNVVLTEGVIEIPRFKPKGVEATFKARAVGELAEMLEIVDRPPLRLISPTGMSPRRFSGRADMQVEITRPMLKAVPFEDYGVRYAGRLEQGGVTDVGIGLDLVRASLAVEGSLDEVKAKGVGRVGPYAGGIDFVSDLKGADAGRKTVVLDGGFSVAGMLSGQGPAGPPFHARLTTRNGDGGAVIRSRVFTGSASWRDKRRVVLNGVGEPGAWKDAGLPVGPDLPARTPVRLTMNGSPGNWAGALEADAYSGHVVLLGVENRRLRYSAEVTPEEARRLGLSDMPMFARTQTVGFEAGLEGRSGWANYRMGGVTGRADWAPGRQQDGMVYRIRSQLDRADMANLGLPLALDAPFSLDLTAVGQRGGFTGQADVAGAAVRFSISAPRGGRRAITFTGEAPAAAATRLGLASSDAVDGVFGLSGRLDRAANGRLSGRVEADLTGAGLEILEAAWSKPAGRRGRAYADIVQRADGSTVLSRVVVEGPGLELSGGGLLARGQVQAFSAPTARIDGFFDGAMVAERGGDGLQLRVDGRYLDARPLLKRAQRPGSGGESLKLTAELERVRVNNNGYLRDVTVNGVWGSGAGRDLAIAARTPAGSALNVRAWPDRGGTALDIKVADLGDVAHTLGGFSDLQGGRAAATGRLAPGGYDLDLDVHDVRVVRAPVMAQLLTVASLQGLADTLNGDGIHFAHIEAPVKLRGSELTLGQATAKGQALGLTAKGVVDLKQRTMDISGSVAPAYAINSAVGALPVLGPLLVSREGEGIFSLTYTAKGAFDRPQVLANPLSLAAPGVLRRVFEEQTPRTKAPASSPAAD